MLSKLAILALTAAPLASAHGKVSVVTGNLGGNTTALGIQGAVVPDVGPNDITEVDTTVFNRRNIKTNGLGETQGQGRNRVRMISSVMDQSGTVLPQVSQTNGSISGVFHIVTSDGAGPLKAVLDPTATGKFRKGVMLEVVTQVPGRGGNIRPQNNNNDDDDEDEDEDEDGNENEERDLSSNMRWARRGEAANINLDFPMEFKIPDGTECTGTLDGVENVCLVKIANSNGAGPFGGVIAIQMAPTATEEIVSPSTTLPESVVVPNAGEPVNTGLRAHCEQVVDNVKRWFGA